MIESKNHISICVCTFKRPILLRRLLDKIGAQVTEDLFDYSVVVVDNDDRESGRTTVESAKEKVKYKLDYYVEPERSISLARNKTVHNAKGNQIAFIDDDEFPDENWLLNHCKILLESKADGVLGPVKPHFEGKAPAWLVKSGLLDRKSFNTGDVIKESRHTRTGNVLLWKRLFDKDGGSFDPAYGRSGGGDAVFFKRMMEKGKTFVWSNEGVVYESVEPERQTRMYYVKRGFTRGMTEAWENPFLSIGTVKSFAAVVIYSCILPFCLLLGQHLFVRYLVKSCDHLAKILAYFGIRLTSERQY
jgi:glycosyltransferase involved in cell wall biosynthesis